MDKKVAKAIIFSLCLIVFGLIFWYAINIFLIAFAAILLAIFLHALGSVAKRISHLPHPLALALAVVLILAIFTLIFWLYSPLIVEQTNLLIEQLPEAGKSLHAALSPYLGFISSDTLHKELSLSNEKFISSLVTIFSSTLGSLVGFFLLIILGVYLALNPTSYIHWIILLFPITHQKRVIEMLGKIGHSLKWWLLGKCVSMIVIGLLTFIGLWMLNINLALILGLLATLLAFIPYVGAILAAIPGILIAFAQGPLEALYVTILYLIIHIIDGYFITPQIEQRTVSIPPALSIFVQMILTMLIGPLGLALATPMMVVGIAFLHSQKNYLK